MQETVAGFVLKNYLLFFDRIDECALTSRAGGVPPLKWRMMLISPMGEFIHQSLVAQVECPLLAHPAQSLRMLRVPAPCLMLG